MSSAAAIERGDAGGSFDPGARWPWGDLDGIEAVVPGVAVVAVA